jgi:antitoxin (DNA-binding transcriptional repressor) of toxin-antitoxin stability system
VKTIDVREAREQLPKLIAEACEGEIIVLKDGDRSVTLSAGEVFDPEVDSPELEAELLKAIDGPFTPYSPDEMRQIAEQILAEERARRK